MSSIKVSVVMAEYNTKLEYLKTSIKSILNQTYKDFEFIIVDDCGNNNLAKIIASYSDDRIRIINNPKNMGLVYSLNNGIKHALGKYIVRMDTDDIAMPNRIEKLYDYITKHPKYDVVGSRVIEFSNNVDIGILAKVGEKNSKSIMRGDIPIHPSVIINKKALIDIGNYDDYHRAEDLALWCKMMLNKKRIFVLDDILLRYRVNPDDYKKRRLNNRIGELKVRLFYYPKLGGNIIDYIRVLKIIMSGILPTKFVQVYRKMFSLKAIEPNKIYMSDSSNTNQPEISINNKPLVSIVVPVYGVENYLQKCINSLVTQSLKNIEIILVDDGSKDSSGQICDQNAKLYPEIIKVIHQVNTGQGGARNNGIKAAHGQYIMFVDGDDYLHTDTIKIAYTAISQNGVDMVVFGINHVNKEGHLIKEEYDGTDFDEVLHTVLDQSLILNSPSPCNKIYRTSLFKKHNIWFPSHVWYEDIRTIMKVYAVIDSIIYIHQTLYNYVQHKESTMHNTHIERNKEILDAFDDIIGYYKANGLFEKYYDELELLTILNVYTAASTRVATVNPNSDLLPLFHSYLSDYFPKYNQNRYIPSLSRQRKILFFLLEKKQYKIVKLLNLLDSRWRTGK